MKENNTQIKISSTANVTIAVMTC